MRVAFAMMISAAALVLPLGGAGAAGSEAGASADDKIICKNRAKTGTRFPKKTCHTRAEWNRISEQAKRDAREEFDQPAVDLRRTGG